LWLFVVVCGCLGVFGIGLSTVSAHPASPRIDLFIRRFPVARVAGHVRRERGNSPPEPSEESGLPLEGAASQELGEQVHRKWLEAAAKAGIDLSGFDPAASLADRIAWARQQGLGIATILSRFSSKLQHSTQSQVEDCP